MILPLLNQLLVCLFGVKLVKPRAKLLTVRRDICICGKEAAADVVSKRTGEILAARCARCADDFVVDKYLSIQYRL